MRKLLLGAVLVLTLAVPGTAFGQATRTWVSGVGNDADPCSRTAPCKTWAGAISQTAAGGEMNAIDSAGYGTLTITKSITLDGAGVLASTLASGGINGIIVNVPGADPQQRVILRNLSINGTGSTVGLNGIRILSAKDVRLENVNIFTFSRNGLDVRPSATAPPDMSVLLDNVHVTDTRRNGIEVATPPGQAQRVSVMVRDSTFSGAIGTTLPEPDVGLAGAGIAAGAGAHVWLTGSTIFDNAFGVATAGDGAIDSFCDNQVAGNGPATAPTDGTFTNTFCQNPPPPTVVTNTVTNTVTVPAPAATPPATPVTATAKKTVVARCVVPKLTGLTLAAATKKLKTARCALGAVTKKRAPRSKRGKVTAQKVAAKKSLAAGAKVALTVGKA
jgi:hypothetical protein